MAMRMAARIARPNYGIDAPGIMVGFLLGGGTAVLVGVAIAKLAPDAWGWIGVSVGIVGALPLFFGTLMTLYWLVGKHRTRNHMLAMVNWRGDETVLDVGTGAGFLMAGVAKQVPHGRVVGIDAWSAKDLSNNSAAATSANLTIEGVAERCDVMTGDARELSFADGGFDCVVSLLCLHNIEGKADQERACREIARVLKPGGQAVIGDYIPTHHYAAALRSSGLRIHQSKSAFDVALSLMWIVVAEKPT